MGGQLTVIFKPTSRCNLRCRYCYAARERETFDAAMGLDEAEAAFRWVRAYCESQGVSDLTVIWHGGEPLLMGAEVIERCVAGYVRMLEPLGIAVTNRIQTNLTLATEAFVPLLKSRFGSAVGFSLDYKSPYRVFPNGDDASETILARAAALREAGIRLSAICLTTIANVGRMRELYDWFKGLGIPFKLNRLFPTSSEDTSRLAGTLTAEQYAAALCELMDIWLNDPDPADAVTVENVVLSYLRNVSHLCAATGGCSRSFLCIAPNGVLLPCGRFDSDTYSIGNYRTDTVEQVLAEKERIVRLGAAKPRPAECASCKWGSLCVAGCLHSRLFGWQEDECVTNKIVWRHVEDVLKPFGLTKGVVAELSPEESSALLDSLTAGGAGAAATIP